MSIVQEVNKGGRRKGFKMPEEHRNKLRVSHLLNRLQKCALGEITLPPDQLKALEICLRKVLPDLSQTEVKADIKTYVARLPEPAPDAAAWLASVDVPMLTSTPVCRQDDDKANKPNDINGDAGMTYPCDDAEVDDYKAD
jgi:hypothetical protein